MTDKEMIWKICLRRRCVSCHLSRDGELPVHHILSKNYSLSPEQHNKLVSIYEQMERNGKLYD